MSQTISGTGSDDVLKGGTGDQTLRGLRGDDLIFGNAGDDKLFGNAGKDTLIGGLGDDYLNGGLSNDQLEGGVGADTLKGGAGKDTFVYKTSDFLSKKIDTIIDFEANDLLDIADFTFGVDTITSNKDGTTSFTDVDTGNTLTILFANGFSSFSADNFVA